MNAPVIKNSAYVAALRQELSGAGPGKRAAAFINQRALFPHRGQAILTPERLELNTWDNQGSITIAPAPVSRITRQFDKHYGAVVGGVSSKWGAPVIIELKDKTAIYILFNHRAFMEKTDNPAWEKTLLEWLT